MDKNNVNEIVEEQLLRYKKLLKDIDEEIKQLEPGEKDSGELESLLKRRKLAEQMIKDTELIRELFGKK
jgi:hypothetical protein